MRTQGHSANKFMRLITVPLRVLGKARDLYVKSLTNCGSNLSYGQSPGQFYGLPRSFSANSAASSMDNEDFKELMRAASVRSLGHTNEIEVLLKQQLMKQMESKRLPKSCSVGMGRIDEDMPCEFEEEEGKGVRVKKNNKKDLLYPRSKSYAVNNGRALF